MSAIWLQGEEGSPYPFLDLTRRNKLELWVFRSPNFGFKDASSLAAAGKNSMGNFYRNHFPEGIHKLKPSDIRQAEDYLERAFSDDVSVTVFLPMIEEEDVNPMFEHPQNWNQLNLQEKADLIVINNMIKLICVADFSSHYFKEVSSLSTSIEEQLNKDSRLDVNAPQDQHPDLKSVLQEIQRTRTKINQHQNEGKDSFQPKTKDDFSLLGLTTNRASQLMSVKGKPISFKSRSKGAVDITIRNPQEFTKFLESGKFQRTHMLRYWILHLFSMQSTTTKPN